MSRSGEKTNADPRPTVLFAAGGTGGHVYPGIAIADALRAAYDVRVVFFGTARGVESKVVPFHGYELELLSALPLKGQGPAQSARNSILAAKETARAVARVRSLAPRALLSVGGYAAGPLSLAAALLRVPVALLEPNSVAGLANRLVAPFARELYAAFDDVFSPRFAARTRLLGVPLRPSFRPAEPRATNARHVLVLGGSQGAQALNERLPRAMALTMAALPPGSAPLEIVHQAGAGRDGDVRAAYAREGLNHVRVVPFLEEVAFEMAKADVIVARSGAVTVAEIAAVGRPAVFVPFPHAADDHQAKNAMALASLGGAICVRQEAADAVRLAREVTRLLQDDEARFRMARACRTHGRPDAARTIASAVAALAGLTRSGKTAPAASSPHASSAADDATNGTTNGVNGVRNTRSHEVN